MREQLKALSKETLIYGASTVVGRFLNFLLVPFYVNVLHSSAEYGISTSLYTYLSFFNILFTMGLEAAYFRYAAKGEGEHRSIDEEKRLFSSPFLFIMVWGGLLATIILVAAPQLVWPAFHDPKTDIAPLVPMLTDILRYGAAIVFLDALNVIPFAVLRLEHKAKRFALIRLLNIVITLILNFVFILGFGWGVEGIFLANLVASLLVVVMLLPTILERFQLRYDRSLMKTLFPFGLTNVPAYLGAMMVQVIDRPIVQAYLGLAMLGIYQANYRMGFTMMVFVSLFEYAWRPFFLKQARTDDARARMLFSRVFTYFMLIALIGFLFLSFVLPYIVSTPIFGRSLLKKEYLVGLNIIPVVLAAYIFQGMYTNFIAGIYIKEHNKVLPYITGIGAVVNVLSNLLLIPILGMMGAALATLLAYLAMAVVIYWQSQKVYFIHYEWKRVGTLAIIVGLAFSIERVLSANVESNPALLASRSALFIAAIGGLFLTDFFSKSELAFVRGLVKRSEPATSKLETSTEPVEAAKEKQDGS
jgi:O-antigen/teichoic acid export membrane protein